jgi:hypothetical protein
MVRKRDTDKGLESVDRALFFFEIIAWQFQTGQRHPPLYEQRVTKAGRMPWHQFAYTPYVNHS